MKLYSNSEGGMEELDEIYFSAMPDELRKISKFLHEMADALDKDSKSFGHAHMKDFCKAWSDDEQKPDIVVFNPWLA